EQQRLELPRAQQRRAVALADPAVPAPALPEPALRPPGLRTGPRYPAVHIHLGAAHLHKWLSVPAWKNWSRRDDDYVKRLLRDCDARADGAPGAVPALEAGTPAAAGFPENSCAQFACRRPASASAGVVQSTYG